MESSQASFVRPWDLIGKAAAAGVAAAQAAAHAASHRHEERLDEEDDEGKYNNYVPQRTVCQSIFHWWYTRTLKTT